MLDVILLRENIITSLAIVQDAVIPLELIITSLAIAIEFEEVVLEYPAFEPKKLLQEPHVLRYPAPQPKKLLSVPVVL